MIATTALELRAGARLLVSGVNVRINHGDRIGFVGRNGAGKSTLAKVLAGENLPAAGAVQRTGKIGYLPQDPRTGEDQGTALDRILSARDLDQIAQRMTQVEHEMATTEGAELERRSSDTHVLMLNLTQLVDMQPLQKRKRLLHP